MLRRALLSLLVLAFLPLAMTSSVSAGGFDPLGRACTTTNEDGETIRIESAACEESETGQGSDNPVTGETGIVERVANILAIVTAIIAIIIIVIAGMTMSLSGGDSTKVQNSRNAIIYAAVGLVVVALARTIVVFVVNRL